MLPIRIQCITFNPVSWQPLADSRPVESLVVYRVSIPAAGAALPLLKTLLTTDELDRAGRYHQPKDRQRFVVSRGTLRVLLGTYTGQHPAAVGFRAGVNKKPVVAGFPGVHYNVSHAGDWVLIAVGPEPVGIDVERIDPAFGYRPLLRDSFSEAEQQFIGEHADSRAAFYRLWTRKEALTKATAKGIDDDFARIPSLDGVHAVAGELMQTTKNWTVGSFALSDTYLGALACPTAGDPPRPGFYAIDTTGWRIG